MQEEKLGATIMALLLPTIRSFATEADRSKPFTKGYPTAWKEA
jgi:hypothetical protein